MKFFSTKQIAELWGISQRRVALLASQGRIPGATSTGKTWLIPENAAKPADNRCRETKDLVDNSKHDIYPYIICTIHSDSQINELTPEGKNLYRACVLHEEGQFKSSQQIAETLLNPPELNVRMGAQYLLAFSCMYQYDYTSAEKYSLIFRNEYYGLSKPSPAIKLLFDAFEAEMGKTSEFVDSISALEFSTFSTELTPFIAGQKLYAELVKLNLGGKMPDISPYEMVCKLSEAEGYHYPAIYLHTILALFYAILQDSEKEYFHLKQAVDICVRYRLYFTFSCMVSVAPETAETILSHFPDEVRPHIRELMNVCVNTRTGYADYLQNHSAMINLDENDYRLISCCLRNYSVMKTSEVLGLSRSGTNKRLAVLYEKMGVESMKEMKKVFLDSVFDWRK